MDRSAREAVLAIGAAMERLEIRPRIEVSPQDPDGWIDAADLARPDAGPMAELTARFEAAGFAASRRAAAASFMLRYGWASGFAVAGYMLESCVPQIGDHAFRFSGSTLLEAVWIRRASVAPGRDPEALLTALRADAEPMIEAYHRWSRFSRHALWAMTVSSWAAQFVHVAERMGDDGRTGLAEAERVFAFDPEIAKAAPELYFVTNGTAGRVCQKRAACCLYYKGPRRHFCASCPILSEEERLERNQSWLAPLPLKAS